MIIITIEQAITFFLVFARMASILTFAPVFSNKEIFSLFKISLCFWISSLTLFFIPLPKALPETIILLILAIVIEVLIGAIIGFISQIFVTAISVGGL